MVSSSMQAIPDNQTSCGRFQETPDPKCSPDRCGYLGLRQSRHDGTGSGVFRVARSQSGESPECYQIARNHPGLACVHRRHRVGAMMDRRRFIVSSAIWFAGTTSLTRASTIRDHMPGSPFPLSAPEFERPGPWKFFRRTKHARWKPSSIGSSRRIPDSPGGKDAGCAVFIDS